MIEATESMSGASHNQTSGAMFSLCRTLLCHPPRVTTTLLFRECVMHSALRDSLFVKGEGNLYSRGRQEGASGVKDHCRALQEEEGNNAEVHFRTHAGRVPSSRSAFQDQLYARTTAERNIRPLLHYFQVAEILANRKLFPSMDGVRAWREAEVRPFS